MKKKTRKQKIAANPEGKGNSKYAKKVSKRRKIAMSLGLPSDATWPQIWAKQDES